MCGWRELLQLKHLAILSVAAVSACSPALNWRVVHLQQLTAMLPCKPDQAQRLVQLAAIDVEMRMAACEADGAQFALAHVDVGVRNNVSDVLAAWKAVTLDNLGGVAPTALPVTVPSAAGANGRVEANGHTGFAASPAVRLAVNGIRTDGSPLKAELAWLVNGTHLYQIVAFGPKLTPDMTETLFTELRIQ